LIVVVILVSVMLAGAACGKATPAEQAQGSVNDGLALQKAGKVDEAAAAYRAALAKDPHNKFAYYNLGLIDQQANRDSSAATNYEQALAIDGDFPPALFNLAIVRTAAAPQEAVDLYQHVIRLKPGNASAHLNLGFVYHTLGKDPEAQNEWRAAIALDPRLAARIPAELRPAPAPSP